ncbi:hypothetical protein GIB67_032917 [Kingdonia uniflora]|uniref:MYND-type domain-containing protein n=1 Tax=Kingdonia uniflora TaxID=39325 RepID=A0A7J7MY70_9MAGN|nr:hypothetical protein GIB67_032917 [Kingdonia uniflora]
MDCAARGYDTKCTGDATRRCGSCGAVAYCSIAHQVSHWSYHKEECARLEEQMRKVNVLHDFPFAFSDEATVQVLEKRMTRCSFLNKRNLHQVGMWKCECGCRTSSNPASDNSRISYEWNLPSILCPCREPVTPIPTHLNSWEDYYEWRCLPLDSPVALLLHWPLTIYRAVQLAALSMSEISKGLHIHYLGPDIELLQLAVLGELHALLPDLQVHIELVGPAVPLHRDGERINLSGYAHCFETGCSCKSENESARREDSSGDSSPHLIVAPNAGVAAYSSWIQTIKFIEEINVPAIFSDYCEEAAHLAVSSISTVINRPLRVPIQLNPLRQPLVVEDSALFLPCYSNCFLFGM